MTKEDMKKRTKAFALRVIKLVDSLPRTPSASAIGNQLLRCGTSVGANYRAACRGKSTADFIHKLTIVEEEADESLFWMELIVEAGLMSDGRVRRLHSEGDEILSIVVATINTTKARQTASRRQDPKSDIRNPKSL